MILIPNDGHGPLAELLSHISIQIYASPLLFAHEHNDANYYIIFHNAVSLPTLNYGAFEKSPPICRSCPLSASCGRPQRRPSSTAHWTRCSNGPATWPAMSWMQTVLAVWHNGPFSIWLWLRQRQQQQQRCRTRITRPAAAACCRPTSKAEWIPAVRWVWRACTLLHKSTTLFLPFHFNFLFAAQTCKLTY